MDEHRFDTGTVPSLGDLQRAPGASAPAAPAGLPLHVERVRTFDTPEFRGMRFLEVETRSALNRVRGMPFQWSINPYRGCSHACSYCLHGETPILMADGRTKPIADVRPGDRVYGTVRRGSCRRYVVTDVLDHWRTSKPAVRVVLEDGTTLVASGDHRFLTDRGWRHVTGAEQGPARRPFLTTNDRLVGTGRFTEPPEPGTDQPRTRTIEGTALDSEAPLRVVAVEALRTVVPMFDITTGTGDFVADGVLSHNCFARPTHAYLNLSPGEDFDKTIVVKTNLVDVLRREVARPSWRGEAVAMGTNTDPYQRCEGRYRLMPGVIAALTESHTPFSILTKGTLVTRDAHLLAEAAERVEASAAFTVGMLDERLWRASEPGTPSPRARLDAVRHLNDAGVPTGVMLAPIMPGLNDGEAALADLVEAAAEAAATHITPIVLHLRPGVRELFWPWLEREHPELVGRYAELYARGSRAAGDYRRRVEDFVAERREDAWRRLGRPVPRRPHRRRDAAAPVGRDAPRQLRLL